MSPTVTIKPFGGTFTLIQLPDFCSNCRPWILFSLIKVRHDLSVWRTKVIATSFVSLGSGYFVSRVSLPLHNYSISEKYFLEGQSPPQPSLE